MGYPVTRDEYPSLASVVAGVLMISLGLVGLFVASGALFDAAVATGAIGQFLVPYGVYKQAEILSSKEYLWAPSFRLIAACTLPVVGGLFGAYYLVRRASVARN